MQGPFKQRWRAECAYDGTYYLGWQSQVQGRTLQDTLEARLFAIFKEKVRVHGSGRTDTGVHARAQVFHFDAAWPHGAQVLKKALSTGLPSDLQVHKLEEAPEGFHARYSVTGKRYIYRMYLGYASPFDTRYVWSLGDATLDISKMQAAALPLLGVHDFSAFAAFRPDGSPESPVKDLRRLEFRQDGPWVELVTEASGYLYKMVRTLTGAFVAVGRGKCAPEVLGRILESRLRPPALITAPPKGLILEHVFY